MFLQLQKYESDNFSHVHTRDHFLISRNERHCDNKGMHILSFSFLHVRCKTVIYLFTCICYVISSNILFSQISSLQKSFVVVTEKVLKLKLECQRDDTMNKKQF